VNQLRTTLYRTRKISVRFLGLYSFRFYIIATLRRTFAVISRVRCEHWSPVCSGTPGRVISEISRKKMFGRLNGRRTVKKLIRKVGSFLLLTYSFVPRSVRNYVRPGRVKRILFSNVRALEVRYKRFRTVIRFVNFCTAARTYFRFSRSEILSRYVRLPV